MVDEGPGGVRRWGRFSWVRGLSVRGGSAWGCGRDALRYAGWGRTLSELSLCSGPVDALVRCGVRARRFANLPTAETTPLRYWRLRRGCRYDRASASGPAVPSGSVRAAATLLRRLPVGRLHPSPGSADGRHCGAVVERQGDRTGRSIQPVDDDVRGVPVSPMGVAVVGQIAV